jgi:hypothetical protein
MAKAGTGKTRLVTAQISDKALKKDLERYRQQAIEMGAADAKIIPADMVVLDERVRLKCWIGRCYNYGQSANCPPYTPEPEFMRQAFRRYGERWGEPPKVVLMQNHGLIALGSSPQQVDNITEMYVKTCRILAGTYAFGGPHFMTPAQVKRIHTRPDELYRRKQLGV